MPIDFRTSSNPRYDYRTGVSSPVPTPTIPVIVGKIYLGNFLLLPSSKTQDMYINRSIIYGLSLIGQNAQ